MIAVLVTIILGLIGGAPLAAVLGTVSAAQWIIMAAQILTATPVAQEEFAKLHPLLADLVAKIRAGMHPTDAGVHTYRAFAAISEKEAKAEQGRDQGVNP